jgi:oxygen-independent coproporphyrinogen-3 oxidase
MSSLSCSMSSLGDEGRKTRDGNWSLVFRPSSPIGLYVHIPFCETKCPYCDFNTYARIEPLIPAYVEALEKEIALWGDVLGNPRVETVFFGGGTPSYLPAERIGSIMRVIRSAFEPASSAEATLEANPGDFTQEKLASYLESGINRLSIGVQSLDDRLLKMLGRRHSAAQALDAYRMAAGAGFNNVSIDLMYGLPYQSLDDWRRTLDGAIELRPRHVSMYCLTLEGGTPMERWVKLGQMPEPDPDLAADMYLLAQEAMRAQGYRHYEISNWAMPGFESRHNLTYWLNQPYLGVGPGAHSYLGGCRFFNLKSPREYIRRLGEDAGAHPLLISPLARGREQAVSPLPRGRLRGGAPLRLETIRSIPVVEGVEVIERGLEMAETLMLGLRLDTGIRVEDFAQRFGVAPAEVYGDAIAELSALALLESVDGWLRLTDRGRILGNEVFSRFFG